MSDVFQNIDPPHPHRSASVPPRLWCGGRTHSLGGEWWGGGNILEDARHCSVLYIRKSFVPQTHRGRQKMAGGGGGDESDSNVNDI